MPDLKAEQSSEWTATNTVLLIVVVGSTGLFAGSTVPGINAVIASLVLGIVVANVSPLGASDPNTDVTSFILKRVLKWAVIMIGAGIDLNALAAIGGTALGGIISGILAALAIGLLVGRRLGLDRRPALLIAVGTAICGASAIAAVAPILEAKREEVGLALATIFTFNAAALVVYPILGHLIGLDSAGFGTWAGIGVHDTAAAVSTGFAYSSEAGEVATIVKLGRTLFLIPIVVFLGARRARVSRDEVGNSPIHTARSIPWFVVGFITVALANTLGWLGPIGADLSDFGKVAIVFVVASVSITLRFSRFARLGRNLMVTGLAASFAAGAVSLAVVLAV